MYMFYCKISSNVRAWKQEKKTKGNKKSMKTTSTRKQLLFRMCSAKSHFNMSYIDKGLFVIIYETKCNLLMQNVMAY